MCIARSWKLFSLLFLPGVEVLSYFTSAMWHKIELFVSYVSRKLRQVEVAYLCHNTTVFANKLYQCKLTLLPDLKKTIDISIFFWAKIHKSISICLSLLALAILGDLTQIRTILFVSCLPMNPRLVGVAYSCHSTTDGFANALNQI